jgi:hypothetical protein
MLVLALVCIGGIGVGAGVGFIREVMDRVFRTTGQVETALKAPCVALRHQHITGDQALLRFSRLTLIVSKQSRPLQEVLSCSDRCGTGCLIASPTIRRPVFELAQFLFADDEHGRRLIGAITAVGLGFDRRAAVTGRPIFGVRPEKGDNMADYEQITQDIREGFSELRRTRETNQ